MGILEKVNNLLFKDKIKKENTRNIKSLDSTIHEIIDSAHESIGMNKVFKSAMKFLRKEDNYSSFRDLNLNKYAERMQGIEKKVNYYTAWFAMYDKHMKSQAKRVKNSSVKFNKEMKRHKIRFDSTMTLNDFKKTNSARANSHHFDDGGKRIYDLLQFGEKMKKDGEDLRYTARQEKLEFDEAKKIIDNLKKNLNIINEVRNLDTHLSDDDVEETLCDLISGSITRSRALKFITEKPEAFTIKSINKSSQIKATDDKDYEYVAKVYDEGELKFLKQRGITNSKAKNLLDYVHYNRSKDFMKKIEKLFDEKKIPKEEAYKLYVHENLLKYGSGQILGYLDMLSSLFDLYNPLRVSGILPRNKPEIYASSTELQNYISQNSNKSKEIIIEGLELITNKKHKQTLQKRLKVDPAANRIKRYRNRGLGQIESPLYSNLKKIVGRDAYFCKQKFGDSKRARIMVDFLSENKFKVTVIDYFNSHNEYTNSFKLRS